MTISIITIFVIVVVIVVIVVVIFVFEFDNIVDINYDHIYVRCTEKLHIVSII